ncbi:DUF3108 domain-containing protein [bacterium]|nr:DUF3108 domain-containing protein [candidate division CSSED10-310 bacterium]
MMNMTRSTQDLFMTVLFGFLVLTGMGWPVMPVDAEDASLGPKREKDDGESILLDSVRYSSANADEPPMFIEPDPMFSWREFAGQDQNPIFEMGEILVYDVSWMGIHAGTITMTLEPKVVFEDKPVFRIVIVGETNKTFSVFFKVHDVVTSYIDPETFNSIHYIKDVREGDYRKLKETRYDQVAQKAWVRGESYDLPPNSKDPVACIFSLRRYAPAPGKSLRMNSNSEGKSNYPVEVGFVADESLELNGDIARSVVRGEPRPTRGSDLLAKKQSKVVFWMTDDEFAVPLRLETKLRIGTLKADLVRRTGPGWTMNRKKDAE